MTPLEHAKEVAAAAALAQWPHMVDEKGPTATVYAWSNKRMDGGFRADFKSDGTADIHALPIVPGKSQKGTGVQSVTAREWLCDVVTGRNR